jgi:hypothetical protein
MRIAPYLPIWSLITLGALAPTVLLKPASVRYAAALGDAVSTSTPSYVHAGVPFVVRDSYSIQFRISSRSGRLLLPLILPAAPFSTGIGVGAAPDVRAGVPFVVRDRNGIQICLSSRGGHSLPPFVSP